MKSSIATIFPLILAFSIPLLPAQADRMDITDLVIAPPCPAIPFYHVRGRLVPSSRNQIEIIEITANGRRLYSHEIRSLEESLRLDKPSRFTWPLFAESRISEFVFRNPWIIARLDWANGQKYDISFELAVGPSKDRQIITKSVVAPAIGGYWNKAWKYYKSVVVSEEFGLDRTDEPVEFTLLFYPDQITNLSKEIRVVHVGPSGETRLLPCQVYSVSSYLEEDKPRIDPSAGPRPPYWLPTVAARVIVPVSIKGRTSQVLLVFYGNPGANPAAFQTDLKVAGKGLDLSIENSFMKIKLHPLSGMIDEISLRRRPAEKLLHKLETNGAVHWNPDAYSPPRPWMHASDWNPPEESSVIRGPVMAMVHRKGFMPAMPEINVAIVYTFFSGQPYFVMTSLLEINKDVPLQALRNAEMVFDHKLIDHAAWKDPASPDYETIKLNDVPLLTEIRLPLDVEWLAFFNSSTRLGFGGIPLESSFLSPELAPVTYNPYLYITRGPWVYWTRVLAAPYLTSNIQQIIVVPAGNSYWEKWAYVPFETGGGAGGGTFKQLENLAERLTRPLRILVTDEKDERVRIPDEIYTDPTKTGWEKRDSK